MNAETLFERAGEFIFSTGLPDSGTHLGVANMRYGLAKIHWVQQLLGVWPNAVFISAPDLTVTRNVSRWRSGFAPCCQPLHLLVNLLTSTDSLVALSDSPGSGAKSIV